MKLSIIIPVYNSEKFLEECLDSLIRQTVSDFEIIAVDDGSTDSSPVILNDYVNKYPGKVRSFRVENGGQGRARNIGMTYASGEYIGFIDSDDWIHTDMFKKMYDTAVKNKADIVVCDFYQVIDGAQKYVCAALQDNPLAAAGSACNKIFRRELVADIRFPEKIWYEDFCFSAKALLVSQNTVYVNEPLYYYRCGHESTMHNANSRKNLDIITAMEDIGKFMKENNVSSGFDFLLINHVLLDAIKRVNLQNTPDKKEVIKELRTYVKKQLPELGRSENYYKETRNRRIIMWLNYHGLEDVSDFLLKVKG